MSSPSFAADIRPLFRERDRLEMEFAFDLWEYKDVVHAADQILERLEEGTMPCDEPWTERAIETFRAWTSAGCPK